MRRTAETFLCCLFALAVGCSGAGDKAVTGTTRDPGKPGEPDEGHGSSGASGKPTTEEEPPSDSCPGCTTVMVGGSGMGFDLEKHPHDGVSLDSDGSLILSNGKDGASAFIWIANTGEQTVSKIDTKTRKEVARYRVGAPDPSRTSVSATGDAYVGSRDGQGLTKLSALGESCPDTNQDGVITTSKGPTDVLAFGQDDCMSWFTKLTDSIRGVAAQDVPATTKVTNVQGTSPMVTTTPAEHYVWAGGGTTGKLFKLQGDTGQIILTTSAPRGIYGLALDGSGLLWMTGGAYWGGSLGVVDTRTCLDDVSCDAPVCTLTCTETDCPDSCDGAVKTSITLNPDSAYGITVDCRQRVWLGGSGGPIKRYDPTAPAHLRLTIAADSSMTQGVHGIAADARGFIWGAVPGQGVLRLDAETMGQSTLIRTDYGAKGIAVAATGEVWAITQSTMAHVITPGANLTDNTLLGNAVTGLVSPYTYSDMTGEQLRLATNEPGHYRRTFTGCANSKTQWRELTFDAELPKGTFAIFRAKGANGSAALVNTPSVLLAVAPIQKSPVSLSATSLADAAVIEIEVELLVEGAASAGRCERDQITPRLKSLGLTLACEVPVQ